MNACSMLNGMSFIANSKIAALGKMCDGGFDANLSHMIPKKSNTYIASPLYTSNISPKKSLETKPQKRPSNFVQAASPVSKILIYTK